MNQNYVDKASLTQQFYRAFGNYFGPHTSTPSMASEHISSAKTQASNLLKKISVKPLNIQQSLSRLPDANSNSLRMKTQTQHVKKQQPTSHHVKSLSSDMRQATPLQHRKVKHERLVMQTESSEHPFLIIQKKARELKKLESRKNTLPSIKTESIHSTHSLTSRLPEVSLVQQIPIIQVTEPQEQFSPKNDQQSEKDDDSPHDDEDSFNPKKMKRLSVKLKFKNAVQQQVSTLFINKQPKSLFNVIISPEFSLKHEEERQKISDAFEVGNFILLKSRQPIKKEVVRRTKIFAETMSLKHPHKMHNIVNSQVAKLTTTNKAFQRKIKMIMSTSENSKELEQPQRFSLLSKYKKSMYSHPNSNENNSATFFDHSKDKFKITITNDQLENQILHFNKPKFLVQVDQVIEESQQNISPTRSAASPSRRVIKHSGSLHQSQRLINLRHSVSQQIVKEETSGVASSQPQVEENNNLDFNLEFTKSNLYVRLYYQSRLYKMPRKTTYTGLNLEEIEDHFTTQQLLIKTANIQFQGTDITGTEIIGPSIDNNLIIPKFILYQTEKLCLSLNLNFTETYSSSESLDSQSLGSLLEEEPFQRFSKDDQESKFKNMIKSLKNIDFDKDETIFVQDEDVKFLKNLSTGTLALIKKARNHFQIPLDLRCIISTLAQSTKNELLTFRQKEIPLKEILESLKLDNDTQAFKLLDKFTRKSRLIQKVQFEMELRYSTILIGRYQDREKVIDIEHQDLLVTLQNLPEIPQLKIAPKSENTDAGKKQDLASLASKITKAEQKISQIANLKKSVHNKKQLKKNQTQTIVQPNLKQKQTQNSPDQTNSKMTMQYSNQLTNQATQNNNQNIVSQSTTQFLTKPTNQSQQSMHIVSGTKIQKSKSNADLSETSSIKSCNSKLEINSSKIIEDDNLKMIQRSHNQIDQTDKKPKHIQSKSQNIIEKIFEQKTQSMQQHSLRMRSHAEEQSRRQRYDQKYQVKFAIQDNNYQEFLENIIQLPEMYIDYRFENRDTFLTLASQSGNKEIVKELIKRGADINAQNDDGNTPLHLTLAYSHYNIADYLMSQGASSHILNKQGKNAWNNL